ncbi:phage tail protein [Aerococcus urinae]|uniref:phage tail protein n=1 Tax=Aerococcus urinae TaxID=1376 RepID=UPI0025507FA0|nr:phage tail protein [Aerococcus urinae]MDK6371998.1 phage tail protein [Aerococcus urinae]
MTDLGKAYVQIVPSAKGISGQIRNAIQPDMESTGESAGQTLGSKLMSAAKKVLVAAGIGKAIAASVMEGGRLEQSIGGVEKLFQGSADKVKNYAKEAFRTSGVSANQYMEQVTGFSASLISSLGGDTEKAADLANTALVDMSDNANTFGTSMTDIKNAYSGFAKQNYTMLDNLRLGYGGTQQEMQRLLADAEKLTGKKFDIQNFGDVVEAIHAIQENMKITGTTANEASQTIEGSFNMMKAAAIDLLGNLTKGDFQNIGQSMKNLIESAVIFAFGNLLPAIGNIFLQLPEAIMAGLATLGPILQSGAANLMQQFGIGLSANSPLNTFLPELQQSFQPVIESIQTALGQIPGFFGSMLESVLPIIESIAGALGKLKFDGIADLVQSILPAIQNAFQTFMGIVGPAIGQVAESFANLWNAAQPLISALADALMPVFEVVASFLGGVVKGALMGLSGAFDLITVAVQILTPVVQFLVDAFNFISPVLSKVAEWIGVLIGLFANFGSSGTSLKSIIVSAWENMQTSLFIAKSAFSDVISGIINFFKNLGNAGSSLKSAINAAFNAIKAFISSAGSTIKNAITGVINFFKNLGNAGSALRSAISSAFNAIKTAVFSAGSAIISKVEGIKNIFTSLCNINLFSAGAAIMEGFLDGLKSMWSAVTDFVGGIADWIRDHKGPIQYDRKLLIPAGRAIMQGLNNGLQDSFKSVKATVNGMGDQLYNAFAGTTPLLDVGFNLKSPYDLSDIDRFNVSGKYTLDSAEDRARQLDQKLDSINENLIKLLAKDTDVYIDKEKVSAEIDEVNRAKNEMMEKYDQRRKGLLI